MSDTPESKPTERGRTVHGEAANAGHRVLAPDDAEVEAYLEQALNASPPQRVETEAPEHPDTVVILDFGSQFAQLIARRVRELNVYSELLPHDTPMAELERRGVKAVILSGGPASVYDADAPRADPALWSGRIPVLGICYGLQLMAHELGGEVVASAKREYGPATVTVTDGDGLFAGIEREQPVWMSHGDSILRPPEGFRPTAQTDSTPFAGLADPSRDQLCELAPEVQDGHGVRLLGRLGLDALRRRRVECLLEVRLDLGVVGSEDAVPGIRGLAVDGPSPVRRSLLVVGLGGLVAIGQCDQLGVGSRSSLPAGSRRMEGGEASGFLPDLALHTFGQRLER